MPLPLDPDEGSQTGMFTAEAEFTEAPEVKEFATELLYEFNDLIALREAVDSGDVVLGYWFDTKGFKPEKEAWEHDTVGKAIKVPPFWRVFSGFDVVIQIRRAIWEVFSEDQRKALVYHELKHVTVVGEQKRVKMVEHSIEEFNEVVRRFGSWLPSRASFFKGYTEWQKEQDAPFTGKDD